MAPAVPTQHGFYDECLKRELILSLGFTKPSPTFPYGYPGAFGAPGSGGSLGFADPQAEVGYAYVTNLLGPRQGSDPREVALRNAFHRSIGMA
jgi:CubicO group peptidase (beta-lactamase class C family)